MRLSQETLADLTSSRRPSVSLALRNLRDQGLLVTPRTGVWILQGESPAELAGTVAEAVLEPA